MRDRETSKVRESSLRARQVGREVRADRVQLWGEE
jgi:hypothetical protein